MSSGSPVSPTPNFSALGASSGLTVLRRREGFQQHSARDALARHRQQKESLLSKHPTEARAHPAA